LKKIVLFILTLTTLALGDSTLYMGTGLSHGNSSIKETPTSQEKKISEDALRLKIGYGNREAYAVELSMDYTKSDPKRYSFDVSVLKAFDFGIYINPFAKVGFGSGILDNRDNANESLTFGSFNAGGGFFIPIGEHFDVECAYELKNISYQKDSINSQSQTSFINSLYLGLNLRY